MRQELPRESLDVNACESGCRVLFIRMIELLNSLMVACAEGNISKLLKKYYRIDLLIIDDFLLTDTTLTEQKNLMEIFEYRGSGKSTMLCSQCSPDEWHTKLGSGYVADAILDRITNNSYSIILEGDSQKIKSRQIKSRQRIKLIHWGTARILSGLLLPDNWTCSHRTSGLLAPDRWTFNSGQLDFLLRSIQIYILGNIAQISNSFLVEKGVTFIMYFSEL
jgi:DNA replication protein